MILNLILPSGVVNGGAGVVGSRLFFDFSFVYNMQLPIGYFYNTIIIILL